MLAPSSHERLPGMAIASRSSISAYSEKAPPQRPITRSPTLKPLTPAPSFTTLPAPSMPIALEVPAFCKPWPRMNSPRFRLAARMRSSSCRAPGSGIATSRSSSDAWSEADCMK